MTQTVVHKWSRCEFCGPMVLCGHCGNNCCNGGTKDDCPDKCASAYAEQDKGLTRMNARIAHPAAPLPSGAGLPEVLAEDVEWVRACSHGRGEFPTRKEFGRILSVLEAVATQQGGGK